jgi:hypothetical protein
MNRVRSDRWLFLAVLLILFHFGECTAGVIIEQVLKDRDGLSSRIMLSFSGQRVRTDDLDRGLTTIMDFKADRMIMIDHKAKNFVEVKFSDWEREMAQRLKEDFNSIPGKHRKIVVARTGQTATMNGFRTERIDVSADGELIEENWVTREVDLSEIDTVMERLSAMFSREFRSEVREGREIYERVRAFGVPVLIKDHAMTHGLGAIDVLEIKRVQKREIKEQAYLAPEGYDRITAPAK